MTAAARQGKVIFLHGQPPHPAHAVLAERLGAEPLEAAQVGSGRRRKALRNALTLARVGEWRALLAEAPFHEGAVLSLADRRGRPRVVLLAGDWPYLVSRHGPYGAAKRRILRAALARWDAYVVQSAATERDLRALLGERVVVTRWLPPVLGWRELLELEPDQHGPAVALMSGTTPHRVDYKGLDRVARFSAQRRALGEAPVMVVGTWDSESMRRFSGWVQFTGPARREEALGGAGLLVHLARRDSFPLAVVEAMLAGVPPVVSGAGSEWLVAAVSPRLVVTSVAEALDAARWLRAMRGAEYSALSSALRNQALRYVEYADSPEALRGVRRLLEGGERAPGSNSGAHISGGAGPSQGLRNVAGHGAANEVRRRAAYGEGRDR